MSGKYNDRGFVDMEWRWTVGSNGDVATLGFLARSFDCVLQV
jgi:hypothetical protein